MPEANWFDTPRVQIMNGKYVLRWRSRGVRNARPLTWWEQIVYRATGKIPHP